MHVAFADLPVNLAILSLLSTENKRSEHESGIELPSSVSNVYKAFYINAIEYICKLSQFLKPFGSNVGSSGSIISSFVNLNLSSGSAGAALSRSMQRKLATLINCQLVEEEGRLRAIRVTRSLGERTVTELMLHHQNHHQLSANLWAAVRARGCQFLGPGLYLLIQL